MKINFHVLQIEFEFRYAPSIFGKITGLGLSKFQRSNSFPNFFPKPLQILTWFLAWKSVTMFYRWSWSFVTHHRFLAKLRALDLVNFSNETVFWTFFRNACLHWPDFWHASQTQWFTDWPWVLLCSIVFWPNSGLGPSKFQRSNSFPDFFPKRYQVLTWFLACKSITMINRSSLSFVTLHRLLAKLRA